MKHISFVLLTSFLVIICCSCSAVPAQNNSEIDSPKTSENTDSADLLPAESNVQTEADENEPQTFTKNFDGVVMTVTTNKSEYKSDELIYVDASLKNTTDEKIYIFVPCLGEDSHAQISTNICGSSGSLIDIDTFMKGFEEAIDVVTVEPSGEYVQSMRFETYTGCDHSSRKAAETGLYSGQCTISLLSDPTAYTSDGDFTQYSLEFSLTLK